MKINKLLLPFFFISFLLLFFVRVLSTTLVNFSDNAIQIFEIIIHLFLIYQNWILYKHLSGENKKILLWLLVTNIFFLLNDSSFYFVIFLKSSGSLHLMSTDYSYLQLYLNNVPYSIWLITITIFLSLMLVKFTINIELYSKLMLILFALNIIIITYYWMPVNFNNSILTYMHSAFLILSSVVEMIIFDLCILCLIYSRTKSFSIFLSGVVIVICGDFLNTYGRMSQIEYLFKYGDSMWCLGMLFMLYGQTLASEMKEYSIRNWFNDYSNIKCRISFWSFSITLFSFIAFFLIADWFHLLNSQTFVMLPLFIMFYSILIVILSLKMGKVFELPFIKIKENISNLLNHQTIAVGEKFAIKEFMVLQEFLVNVLKIKEEQDTIRRQIVDIAASTAHDVVSPINAIRMTLTSFDNTKLNSGDVEIMSRSLDKIQKITDNLLTQYRLLANDNKVNDKHLVEVPENNSEKPRFFIFSELIKQLIYDKVVEFGEDNIILDIKDTIIGAWVYGSPLLMSRSLSNILNNAYESTKEIKNIYVSCFEKLGKIAIKIKDQGCGIPHNELENVLSGKSLKHSGHGLGLRNTKSYFDSIGGELQINSQINIGTTVEMLIPVAENPSWYNLVVKYNKNTLFVVIDDDQSMLLTWQNHILPDTNDRILFDNDDKFYEWYEFNKDHENIIIFTDFNLNCTTNGFDITKVAKKSKSYLVTSYAEDEWLQQIVSQSKIFLIPKSQLKKLRFTMI